MAPKQSRAVSNRSHASTFTSPVSKLIREETKEPESEESHPAKQGDETADAPEKENDDDASGNEEPQEEEEEEEEFKLYKSTRLKGYIVLTLASGINYSAAYQSDEENLNSAVPASTQQSRYAETVALVSIILSFFAIIAHLVPPFKRLGRKAFQPKSYFEFCLIFFLLIWWIVATWIQTSVQGVAGDGKGQYNLYFSTWACCWTSIWTLERWMVKAGLSSFKSFLASWPNRAPGWIAVMILSASTLLCYVDLYFNWEDALSSDYPVQLHFARVPNSQWQWLLFISAFTVPFALGFVLVEIFRENKPDAVTGSSKSDWENILEGFVCLVLIAAWIPSVVVATAPGGIASLVGNAYFFTWATAVFVMETAVWWIHDWRQQLHEFVQEQENEYRNIQLQVLQQGLEAAGHHVDDDASSASEGGYQSRGESSRRLDLQDDDVSRAESDAAGSAFSEYDEDMQVIPDVVGN